MKSQITTNSNSQRIIGLDIIRSVAILIVMLQHGQFLVPDSKLTRSFTQIFNLIDGVSIFFVLSGFLIGKLIINQFVTKNISIKTLIKFWIKRWLRTLPNYYLILLIFAILFVVNSHLDFLNISKTYYFFFQNIQENKLINFKESWSLSVEEWFYFSFPLFLFLSLKTFSERHKKTIFALVILIYLIIPLGLRFQTFKSDIAFDFRKIVIYRLDAIIYGVLGAFVASNFQNNWFKYRYVFSFFGLLLYALIILNPMNWKESYSPIFYSVESIGILFLFPLFTSINQLKWKPLSSFFTFFSSISYSLYLVNLTLVQMVCLPFLKNIIESINCSKNSTELILYISFWMVSISISALIYYAYERPILRWRNRIFID